MVARIHRDFSISAHSHSALRVSQNKICFGLKFTSAREGRRSYWLIMTADDSVKSQFAHSTMKGQVKGLSASFSFCRSLPPTPLPLTLFCPLHPPETHAGYYQLSYQANWVGTGHFVRWSIITIPAIRSVNQFWIVLERRLHDRKAEHLKALAKNDNNSTIADHVKTTRHNIN